MWARTCSREGPQRDVPRGPSITRAPRNWRGNVVGVGPPMSSRRWGATRAFCGAEVVNVPLRRAESSPGMRRAPRMMRSVCVVMAIRTLSATVSFSRRSHPTGHCATRALMRVTRPVCVGPASQVLRPPVGLKVTGAREVEDLKRSLIRS